LRHPAHATSELIDVVSLVTQAFWAELRRSGQTIEMSQWSTLKRIDRAPCTVSELARYKGVGLPTISKSIDMLVKRGWVERWVDKSDRRQTLVRLTPAGRKLLTTFRKALESFLDSRLASLTAAERDAIDASMQLVRRVLTDQE
jgi:DNA-binding MarR family transcriptional regulator